MNATLQFNKLHHQRKKKKKKNERERKRKRSSGCHKKIQDTREVIVTTNITVDKRKCYIATNTR